MACKSAARGWHRESTPSHVPGSPGVGRTPGRRARRLPAGAREAHGGEGGSDGSQKLRGRPGRDAQSTGTLTRRPVPQAAKAGEKQTERTKRTKLTGAARKTALTGALTVTARRLGVSANAGLHGQPACTAPPGLSCAGPRRTRYLPELLALDSEPAHPPHGTPGRLAEHCTRAISLKPSARVLGRTPFVLSSSQ